MCLIHVSRYNSPAFSGTFHLAHTDIPDAVRGVMLIISRHLCDHLRYFFSKPPYNWMSSAQNKISIFGKFEFHASSRGNKASSDAGKLAWKIYVGDRESFQKPSMFGNAWLSRLKYSQYMTNRNMITIFNPIKETAKGITGKKQYIVRKQEKSYWMSLFVKKILFSFVFKPTLIETGVAQKS